MYDRFMAQEAVSIPGFSWRADTKDEAFLAAFFSFSNARGVRYVILMWFEGNTRL
jgi:hypothetical protein